MSGVMKTSERKEYQHWLELKEQIRTATVAPSNEKPEAQRKRVKKLLSSFADFCEYYFPHYVQSPFGWFHLEAARAIEDDPNIFAVLEWPREHAKSVFADVMLPMFLKAKGELTGMMIASANGEKANGLLGDIQAELMDNERYIQDFGEQYRLGDWQNGSFTTADGCGFWAFGRGQSPRGTRKIEKRPNYGVVDDIDDSIIVRNDERVRDAVDWVLGDFFGAMSIKGARLIIAGNRIHKKAILAHLVGDVELDDKVNPKIKHIKVYAIQQAKGGSKQARQEGSPDKGVSAWPERYSIKELMDKMEKMGWRNSRREFFHQHIEEGFVFKQEHIIWAEPQALSKYDSLITYNDPSFKDTKSNDYKFIVLLGRHGKYIDVLKAWGRQTNTGAMVAAHYDLHEYCNGNLCRHYMEANFMQDMLLSEYDREGEERGYMLPIRPDKRKKPDKYGRIENLSPLCERKILRFSSAEKNDPDMQTLVQQFLGFPFCADDGPDAVEGGVSKLDKISAGGAVTARTGGYNRNKSRRG